MNGGLGLLLTCVVIIGVPGPSVLFIIGQALARGRARGIVSVLGNTLGMAVLAVVFAAGVSELIAREPRGADVIRWVGAAVLVGIGVFYVRGPAAGAPVPAPSQAPAPTGGAGRAAVDRTGLGQSFAVGLTNPKGMVMFGVIVPSYASTGASAQGLLALSAIPLLVGLVLDTAWVLLAAWARAWLTREGSAALRRFELAGGLLILALAVELVFSG